MTDEPIEPEPETPQQEAPTGPQPEPEYKTFNPYGQGMFSPRGQEGRP